MTRTPRGDPLAASRRPSRAIGGGAAVALLALLAGCAPDAHADLAARYGPYDPGDSEGLEFEVPPPPFSDGAFPCSDCHDPEDLVDIPARRERRELRYEHLDIVLDHDEEHRWCLDCHDGVDRDRLHLASGELVDFTESHRLCGQCHGDKHRDWRAGVHGRRTGRWDGEKGYLLCVHCHDSHAPAFRPLTPLPAPTPPERTR